MFIHFRSLQGIMQGNLLKPPFKRLLPGLYGKPFECLSNPLFGEVVGPAEEPHNALHIRPPPREFIGIGHRWVEEEVTDGFRVKIRQFLLDLS